VLVPHVTSPCLKLQWNHSILKRCVMCLSRKLIFSENSVFFSEKYVNFWSVVCGNGAKNSVRYIALGQKKNWDYTVLCIFLFCCFGNSKNKNIVWFFIRLQAFNQWYLLKEAFFSPVKIDKNVKHDSARTLSIFGIRQANSFKAFYIFKYIYIHVSI
jgi:hypothetical protein